VNVEIVCISVETRVEQAKKKKCRYNIMLDVDDFIFEPFLVFIEFLQPYYLSAYLTPSELCI
jgi:hypothetical protein